MGLCSPSLNFFRRPALVPMPLLVIIAIGSGIATNSAEVPQTTLLESSTSAVGRVVNNHDMVHETDSQYLVSSSNQDTAPKPFNARLGRHLLRSSKPGQIRAMPAEDAMSYGSMARGDSFVEGDDDNISIAGYETFTNSTEARRKFRQFRLKRPWLSMSIGAASAMLLMMFCSWLGVYCSLRGSQGNHEQQLQRKFDDFRVDAHATREILKELRMERPDFDNRVLHDDEVEDTGPQPETYEELMGELSYISKKPDRIIRELSSSSEAQTAAVRILQVREFGHHKLHEMQKKVTKWGQEVTIEYVEKLQKAMDDPDLPKEMRTEMSTTFAEEMSKFVEDSAFGKKSDEAPPLFPSEFLPPATSIIVAGLLARSQVSLIWLFATAKIYYNCILFSVTVGFLAIESQRPCKDWKLFYWTMGMLLMCILTVFFNAAVRYRCAAYIEADEIDYEETLAITDESSGDPVMDAWLTFQRSRTSFLNMLFRLRTLEESRAFWASNLLSLVGFCWDLYAVYISIAEVVELEYNCSQRNLVRFMQAYSLLTLVFFLYVVIGAALCAIHIFKRVPTCVSALMSFVRFIDMEWFAGVPILNVLIRSFYIRDATTMYKVYQYETTAKVTETEIDLTRDRQRLAAEIEQAKLVASMLNDAKQTEENWMHAYEAKVGITPEQDPMVAAALAAATQYAERMPEVELDGDLHQQVMEATKSLPAPVQQGMQQGMEQGETLLRQADEPATVAAGSTEQQLPPQSSAALTGAPRGSLDGAPKSTSKSR